MTPPEKVADAMPGTLKDLSKATGYPVGSVLKQINTLRRSGVRVNAVAEAGAIGVCWPIEADVMSTIYVLVNTSREE
jgi:hypothetical protein